MFEQPKTRQELYEQIRQQGGKDVFVLEQMVRLGFWTSDGMPDDPAEELRRAGEIQKELDHLRAENRRLYNEQALLKELRQKRLAESRRKQKETKERRERERLERAETWRKRQEKEIIYLGEGVSSGLNNFESNAERLKELGLPNFVTVEDLAEKMNVTVNKLRFLAFSRRTSEVSHYIHFNLPKKTGGLRLISAPMPDLKAAQHWILERILQQITVHEASNGFLSEKNIVSNARPHVGAQIVVNFDLENFFPSISYPRVKGMFRSLGYSDAISTILALICTAPDVEEVSIDGKNYFVAVGERHLPQGAPTSPAISNIISRGMDKGLTTVAKAFDYVYTRYADDLTFSTKEKINWDDKIERETFKMLLNNIRFVVEKQGFAINEDKTRILRRGRQQEVTGIVVNDKISIDRKTLRKFRACLHQVENEGIEGKHWGNSPDLIASLQGYANFVFMVDKEKGVVFQQQVKRIIEKHGWTPTKPKFRPNELRKNKPDENTPQSVENADKPWWKLW
jgi:retron-type reverse transcriptase